MTHLNDAMIRSQNSIKLIYFLFLALFTITTLRISASDYKITTANLPPWSFDDGKNGIFIDIVAEIEKRLGTKHIPESAPWNRALMKVTDKNDYLMFPLTRTEARENKYTWIVKIMPYSLSFISYSGGALNFQQAEKLDSVLVHQNSHPYYILKNKGFENIVQTSHWFMYGSKQGVTSILKRMKMGRVAAWFEATTVVKHITTGIPDSENLVYGPPLIKDSWLYIVGSKDISDSLVKSYRESYKTIKADGTLDKILAKYNIEKSDW